MSPAERAHYFKRLWPAACAAKGWRASDDEKRRAVALECMQLVRGPLVTTSSPIFGRDEVTALFCYLEHLGDPASLDKSARWDTCQQDYRTYNRARQADWHERALYGRGKNRLNQNRFGGATTAAGGPLDELDADTVRKRHLSVASRHQKKVRQERAAAKAGPELASSAAASQTRNAPAPVPRLEVLSNTAAEDEGDPF
jgi:hypothetical protein